MPGDAPTASARSAVHALRAVGGVHARGFALAGTTPTECLVPIRTVDAASVDALPAYRELLQRLPITGLHVLGDPAGDAFLLDGAEVIGTGDAATDILGVHHARFRLDRPNARTMRRWLLSPAAKPLDIAAGQPVDDLFAKPGEFDLFFLDTAGDPTTVPEATRVWQIGFMGARPDRTIAPVVPETHPLAGVQWLATYGQFVSDGAVRDAVAASDFGSRTLGPDRSTQYYNAAPALLAGTTPDGVFLITPARFDPLGYRPMGYDGGTGAWDFAAAPGGPMAFIPVDGAAPGPFDLIGLTVQHQPFDGQTFVLDGTPQAEVTTPSGNLLLGAWAASGAGTVPTALDLHLSVDGSHTLAYEQIPPEATGQTLAWRYGITQYGRWCVDDIRVDGAQAVPILIDRMELARAMGTWCWQVDAGEGPLHRAAWDHFDSPYMNDRWQLNDEWSFNLGVRDDGD